MSDQIVTWPQAYPLSAEQCGGKGWNLARLHFYGFQIPAGGIVTSQPYKALITQPRFQSLIKQVCELPTQTLMDGDNELLDRLAAAFLQASLADGFKLALSTFLEQQHLSDRAVSVRSSVNQEDGESASFAGIHDSVLNVRGVSEIEAAILQCYASLWRCRAIAYRRKMDIADEDVTMALVINEMVAAESAGVAFSCDSASGRQNVITINANYGLGESVVSGAVEPDYYRLNRFTKDVLDKQIGSKRQYCRAKPGGGSEWLATENANTACLNDQQLKQLAALCDRVFHALGQGEKHQDIEWAFDGNQFFLLQARPVTAMKKVVCDEISGQPDIWSNGNFRDAIPMVLPRLMAGFCDQHINDILHSNFARFYFVDPALRFARQFEGRFYCNASLLQWLWFDAVGFPPEKLNISLGGHQPLIAIDAQYKKGMGRKLKRLWQGIQFFRLLTAYRKKSAGIIASEIAFANSGRKINFAALNDQQLIEVLHDLDRHQGNFNASFIMLTSQSGALFMLIQTLEKYVGERAYQLANGLMAHQADITSANQGYALQALALQLKGDAVTLAVVQQHDFQPKQWRTILPEGSVFKQDFGEFIEQYGHRAVYEIDLSRARWREDPSYLFDCIKAYIKASPEKNSQQNAQQENDGAWQEVLRAVPRYLHGQVKKQLAAAAQGVGLKEQSKSVYVRLMEPMRLALLEIGARMANRDLIVSREDVFHCAQCELDGVMEGAWDGRSLKGLIDDRKAIKLRHEQLPAVDVIFDDMPQQRVKSSVNHGSGLRGIGVAAGVALGTARLIKSPEEGGRLSVGDVLVAPSTDPAWTPLFLNASAIVMETGGYLSHGSIVAREYGIPAVVNIEGLFEAIKDGDQLSVDGNQGVVEIL